jgi:hypothetical protein
VIRAQSPTAQNLSPFQDLCALCVLCGHSFLISTTKNAESTKQYGEDALTGRLPGDFIAGNIRTEKPLLLKMGVKGKGTLDTPFATKRKTGAIDQTKSPSISDQQSGETGLMQRSVNPQNVHYAGDALVKIPHCRYTQSMLQQSRCLN